MALRGNGRRAPDSGCLHVAGYRTSEEKGAFESRLLPAACYGCPEERVDLFIKVKYSCDHYCIIVRQAGPGMITEK